LTNFKEVDFMGKLVTIFLLVLLIADNSIGQIRYDPKNYPYNKNPHSVRRHSGLITAVYTNALSLNRWQKRQIREEVKRYYTYPGTHEGRTALGLHLFLKERLKNTLTVKQYDRYIRFRNYPELEFSGGAPEGARKKPVKELAEKYEERTPVKGTFLGDRESSPKEH
jgi:hypothetical protein